MSSDGLSLRVLGAVELPGQDDLPGRLRRLLAVLVVAGGSVVSVDRLIDVLWGEELPADPEAALHSVASRLRARLRRLDDGADGQISLVTRSPGYFLQLNPTAVDATAFEIMTGAARARLADRPAEAEAILTEALGLWRGAAYAEFADEDFARPEAARLEQLRLTAIEDRAEAALAAGRHDAAVAELEAFVAQEPLRERPHRQLMVALYRTGRQTDALAVARTYRERLIDELGLDPTPELQHLEQQLLRHDDRLTAPAPVAQIAAEVAEPVLPSAEPSPLFGRDEELDELATALRPGALLTLTGPGGVGKTSLARQAARRSAPRFADAAVTVELAAVSSGDEVAAAVSTALGLQPRPDLGPLERVVDSLAGQHRLVLLDNCEHVIDAAADLTEALLGSCPGVAVLATSRSPLDVPDEQVWAVTPLAAPDAVQLFQARASARNRNFVLDDGNAAAVAEICRRLDGLPLAIELAAARMSAMTPTELLSLLSWRFSLLHGGRRVAERHRTLRALVDWSYTMLDDDTRFAFDVLSVFAGSFTFQEADAMVAAAADAVGRPRPAGTSELLTLLDRSMVTVSSAGATTRYVLLETLRAYGRERLSEWDQTMTVRGVHAEMFAGLAADAGAQVFGVGHLEAVARLDSALDELRTAWAWGIEHHLPTAVRLVGGLTCYVELRMPAELGDWAERTVGAIEREQHAGKGNLDQQDRATLLGVAAAVARFAGDLDRARRLAEDGLELEPDAEAEAYLRYILLEVALFQGRLAEVEEEEARLAALRPTGMVGPLATMNKLLARTYRGEAAAAIEEAEAIYAQIGRDRHDVLRGWTAYVLAEILVDQDPERADDLLREALSEARRYGDRYLTGVALVAAAAFNSRHGTVANAVPLFLDVIEHWRALGDWVHQWSTLRNVQALLIRADRLTEAAELHGACTSRADRFPIFGADAERLAAARDLLERRLGPDRFAELSEQGGRLTDLEVIDLARRALQSMGRS